MAPVGPGVGGGIIGNRKIAANRMIRIMAEITTPDQRVKLCVVTSRYSCQQVGCGHDVSTVNNQRYATSEPSIEKEYTCFATAT